jgi:hypothetical protein
MTADRCDRHIPANGAACQHLVHGVLLTYNLATARAEQLPDAACTDCYFTYERAGDVDAVWDKMGLHMLYRNCYQEVLVKHVLPTPEEQERGFSLVTHDKYYSVRPLEAPQVGALPKGAFVKLGFFPIPSQHPRDIEKMWVRILRVTSAGMFQGELDNDPKFFDDAILRAGSELEFSADHVLERLEE